MKKFKRIIENKSKKLVICSMICIIMVLCACQKKTHITSEDVPEENKISTPTDRVIYTDEELQIESSVIAKVEVMDELSSENSLIEFSKEYGMVINFCAVRSVRVLDVYKSDGELYVADEFQIQEDCAIYKTNDEYFQETMDDILPLQKGQTYLLFLDDGADTMSGKPAIMSFKIIKN